MPADAVEKALARSSASARCATPCGSQRLWVLATAACRDASNGKDFIAAAEQICRAKIDVISGQREAELTALGVVSGFHQPDGIVGDLGGGSLELVDVHGSRIRPGITLPLGGLALQDLSGALDQEGREDRQGRASTASSCCRAARAGASTRSAAPGARWRSCTWRRPAIRCMSCTATSIRAKEALEFARLVRRVNPETLSQIEVVNAARRPLLPYAALVLEHIVREAEPREVVFSALGVREGLLYSLLDAEERKQGRAARVRRRN